MCVSVSVCVCVWFLFFFFFNDTATTEIYTLSHTTLFRSKAHEGDEPPREGNQTRAETVDSRSKPLERRWPGGSGSDCGGRAGQQAQEGKVAPETERPSRGGNPWRESRTP